MNARVSLLTPCFQGERYLEFFLKSVEEQTEKDLQFIFVNDGSSDRTGEIFKVWRERNRDRFSGGIDYLETDHLGQAAAVNAALKKAGGHYLTWADADDVLHPEAIKEKADWLDAHDGVFMVKSNGAYISEDGIRMGTVDPPSERKCCNVFDGIFQGRISCLAGTYMLRTDKFFEIYKDKSVPVSQEGQNLQMLLPVASVSKCGYINRELMFYRLRKDSHSHRPRTFSQEMERIEGFYRLLLELLPFCDVDREKWTTEAQLYRENERERLCRIAARKVRET